jgi:hypothetical protein
VGSRPRRRYVTKPRSRCHASPPRTRREAPYNPKIFTFDSFRARQSHRRSLYPRRRRRLYPRLLTPTAAPAVARTPTYTHSDTGGRIHGHSYRRRRWRSHPCLSTRTATRAATAAVVSPLDHTYTGAHIGEGGRVHSGEYCGVVDTTPQLDRLTHMYIAHIGRDSPARARTKASFSSFFSLVITVDARPNLGFTVRARVYGKVLFLPRGLLLPLLLSSVTRPLHNTYCGGGGNGRW